MARRTSHVALITVLLISVSLEMNTANWVSDLQLNLNRMTQNINEQVQRFTNQLNSQIHESVQPVLEQASKTLQYLPRDEHGRIITTNGNSFIVSSENGRTRTITSGFTADGQPYVRDIKEWHDGNILYHNETAVNPRTRAVENIFWKLNLTDPDAKPEILKNEE